MIDTHKQIKDLTEEDYTFCKEFTSKSITEVVPANAPNEIQEEYLICKLVADMKNGLIKARHDTCTVIEFQAYVIKAANACMAFNQASESLVENHDRKTNKLEDVQVVELIKTTLIAGIVLRYIFDSYVICYKFVESLTNIEKFLGITEKKYPAEFATARLLSEKYCSEIQDETDEFGDN